MVLKTIEILDQIQKKRLLHKTVWNAIPKKIIENPNFTIELMMNRVEFEATPLSISD